MSYSSRVVFYVYSEKIRQIPQKIYGAAFFGKVVGFQHPNVVEWNPAITALLEITENVF